MNDTSSGFSDESEAFGEDTAPNIPKDIVSNARKETEIKNPSTNYFMEVDIWIPKLKLCFEFQDPYHYVSTWDSQNPTEDSHEADSILPLHPHELKSIDNGLKHQLLCQRGETLLAVPCWWQGDSDSLIGTIKFQRPDLNYLGGSKNRMPISLNQPLDFFKELAMSAAIPMIGEPMLASFVKSNKFKLSSHSPWWMGEKYDGVRFCWSSYAERLYPFMILSEWAQALRATSCTTFDSLSFFRRFGRGQFLDAQKLVLNTPLSIAWPLLRMVVFDDPNPLTQHLAFEKRYASVLDTVNVEMVATRMLCRSRRQLSHMLMNSIDEGGEGVILRKPASVYEHGRSKNLLKLKAARGDNEALVVEAEDISSLVLQLPNGVTFRTPSPLPSEQTGTEPIKKGDIVTFIYESYSRNSVPLKPEICRVRRDKTWTHVVRDFSASVPKKTVLNNSSQEIVRFSPKPHRFWTSDNRHNARLFFENVARSRKMDPLVAENWYPLTNKIIESHKGGEYALNTFGGSLSTALSQLFPEIGIDRSKFKGLYQRYWFEVGNRRKFFEQFAAKHDFDPLISDNWYPITKQMIITKGGRGIIDFYPGSNVRAAIIHAFPEIGLDKNKFPTKDRYYWTDPANRRRFFVTLAAERNIDPLVADGWYQVTLDDVIAAKGGHSVLEYYKSGHQSALAHLFPEVKFDIHKFHSRKSQKVRPLSAQ